jgi:hypothetical protein
MGNGTVQESGRNRNPLKKHKPPKMTTWGILNNLRGEHILSKKSLFFLHQYTSCMQISTSEFASWGNQVMNRSITVIGLISFIRINLLENKTTE